MDELLSRFQGCLLGLATGDVLGCLLESMRPEAILARFGRVVGLVARGPEEEVNRYYWRLAGMHSDDTQQALVVADTLIENGSMDVAAFLACFKRMSKVQITSTCACQAPSIHQSPDKFL